MGDLMPLQIPGLDKGCATLVANMWLITRVALEVELEVVGAQEGGVTLCALVLLLLPLLTLLTWHFLLNKQSNTLSRSRKSRKVTQDHTRSHKVTVSITETMTSGSWGGQGEKRMDGYKTDPFPA